MELKSNKAFVDKVILANQRLSVELVCPMDQDLAKALGVERAFYGRSDGEMGVRDGLKKVELDNEYGSPEIILTPDGVGKIPELQVSAAQLAKLCVIRKGDGKKKAKRLVLRFRAVGVAGDPLAVLSWYLSYGAAQGGLSVRVMEQVQAPLQPAKDERVAKKGRPKNVDKLADEIRQQARHATAGVIQ